MLTPMLKEKGDGRLSAMMAVVNLIGSEESKDSELMVADNGIIERILGEIRGILDDVAYFHEEETGETKSTFDLNELLLSLSKLSVNDSNKMALFKGGVVSLLQLSLEHVENPSQETESSKGTLSNEDTKTEAQLLIFRTLINLCFIESIRNEIVRNHTLRKISLRLRSEGEPSKVQPITKRFLWILDNGGDFSDPTLREIQQQRPTKRNTEGKHVMFSYCWSDQPQVLKIKNLLAAAGFKIWIDVESLSVSTVDSMAKAVEEAVVVLVCFSERYKQSQNCRMEANYAFQRGVDVVPLKMQQNYVPDGWLGLMIASKLYIDFSEDSTFKAQFNILMRELKVRAGPAQGGSVELVSSAQEGETAQTSPEDVAKWLADIGLSESVGRFKEQDMLDSLALRDLFSLWQRDQRLAFEVAKEDLALSSLGLRLRFFRELAKFVGR